MGNLVCGIAKYLLLIHLCIFLMHCGKKLQQFAWEAVQLERSHNINLGGLIQLCDTSAVSLTSSKTAVVKLRVEFDLTVQKSCPSD